METAKTRVAELEPSLAGATEQNTAQEQELKAAKEKVNQLEQSLKTAREQIEELKKDLDSAVKKQEDLENGLSVSNQELYATQQALEEYKRLEEERQKKAGKDTP